MSLGFVIWLTGLSGAGKSTLAERLEEHLSYARDPLGIPVFARPVDVLDGDVVRTHLSAGLGFSRADRDVNVMRIGWVASRLARAGAIVIVSAISPFRVARSEARAMTEAAGCRFVLVHVDAPLETLIARDVKGLYARALAGEIEHFTGISADPDSEYEVPYDADLCVNTATEPAATSAARVLSHLSESGLI